MAGGAAAPLLDLNINDLLNDPGLALVAGSVTLAGSGAGGASVVLGNGANDVSIRVSAPPLDPGAELRITCQGRISDTVQADRIVPNTAIVQGDSAPTRISTPLRSASSGRRRSR